MEHKLSNAVWKYRCDLWIKLYGRLMFGDFDTNLVLAGSTTKRHTFDFFEILLITSNWHKI